jgi:hypothetical protein
MIASARSKNASTTTWRSYGPGRSTIRPTHSAVTRGLRGVPARRGDVRRPRVLRQASGLPGWPCACAGPRCRGGRCVWRGGDREQLPRGLPLRTTMPAAGRYPGPRRPAGGPATRRRRRRRSPAWRGRRRLRARAARTGKGDTPAKRRMDRCERQDRAGVGDRPTDSRRRWVRLRCVLATQITVKSTNLTAGRDHGRRSIVCRRPAERECDRTASSRAPASADRDRRPAVGGWDLASVGAARRRAACIAPPMRRARPRPALLRFRWSGWRRSRPGRTR